MSTHDSFLSNLLQALFSFLYHRVEQLAGAALERVLRVSEHTGMPDSEILFIVGPHITSMLLLGGGGRSRSTEEKDPLGSPVSFDPRAAEACSDSVVACIDQGPNGRFLG